MIRTLVTIPVYGAETYPYAARAARSAVAHGGGRVGVVVYDDASPGVEAYYREPTRHPLYRLHEEQPDAITVVVGHANAGLTTVWNQNLGLALYNKERCRYAVLGNSDLVFAPDWEGRLAAACDVYDLVGPVTNAPGHAFEQDVRRFLPKYRADDSAAALAKTAAGLRLLKHRPARLLNGFCLAARVESWWKTPFAEGRVFDPDPRYRLVGSEDELQRRWRAAGRRFGVAPASFVFHYRSVTRGIKFGKGQAYRPAAPLAATD